MSNSYHSKYFNSRNVKEIVDKIEKKKKNFKYVFLIFLITSLAVVFPDSASAEEFRFRIPSGHTLTQVEDVVVDSSGNIFAIVRIGNVIKFSPDGTVLLEFGSFGSGEGQFNVPRGIALDISGNIYVTDRVNHRVQIFDSTGVFQSMFGWGVDTGANLFETCTSSCRFGIYGFGAGQFNNPQGIAVDISGNIYVVDRKNHRVQIFDSTGVFQSMFGWSVDTGANLFETCTSSCQFGISGSGDGQFSSPDGIAVDDSGNIYVADSNNNRIQKFNSFGVFQSKFGTFSFGNGQLDFPQDITIDSSGNIYVVDNNDRVQKFNPAGGLLLQFGSFGSGNDQFDDPRGIAVDISGNIYVADRTNQRIQIFDSTGVFQSKLSTFCTISSGANCVDPDGGGPLELGDGQFNNPRGIAVGSSGNIYVADRTNNRIQIFDSTGVFQSKFGSSCFLGGPVISCVDPDGGGPLELGDGQFRFPQGIALDISGNIYVADSSNHRIQIFDSFGVFQSKFGTFGPNDGQFSYPRGIAVDDSGNIYVADSNNDRIQIFDSTRTFQSKFGSSCYISTSVGCVDLDGGGPLELGDGQFRSPGGIAVDGVGNIYVADFNNDRIQIFDSFGVFQSKFGSDCIIVTGLNCVDPDGGGPLELGDGQFELPLDITLDDSGNIYVADWGNSRIQIFDSTGVFQSKFGSLGTSDGQFSSPRGIAVDDSGNIYVADSNNNRIQKFVDASCIVPGSGDMIITVDCILSGIATAPANVIVKDGAIMIISNGATLDIDSSLFNLTVESGSEVLIKAGGTINNYGAINNNAGGTINNDGTINNNAGGIINNNGNIINNLSGIINNSGFIDNLNTINNCGTLNGTIPTSGFPVIVDCDGDGIQDNVDIQPSTFSNNFTDLPLGGTTSGGITIRGDRTWNIQEEPNSIATPENDGVNILVSAGSFPAQVVGAGTCSPKTINDIALAGANFVLSCGSNFVRVLEGSVTSSTTLNQQTIIVNLNSGDGVKYDLDSDGNLLITNLSETESLTIMVNGDELTIASGQTVTDTDGDGVVDVSDASLVDVQPDPVQSESRVIIPDWIKTNAGWWSEGQINDDSFVEGIKYLIKEDIMRIPETKAGTVTSQEIPPWIKQNAGWWSAGQISDDSFVNGVQWLIKNGIMKIG